MFVNAYNSDILPNRNGTDYVVNGDFSQTQCNSGFCSYPFNSYQPNYLVGWWPILDLELGKSTTYLSSMLPSTKIVI
jgi:hypothetical protein